MSETVKHTSDIIITVGLNEERVPVSLDWKAEDDGQQQRAAKAMLLSLFDEESKETLKIDLWTNEMQVIEMDRFFFQTLRALADTYFKATQNAELATNMQQFVQFFGEKTGIIQKKP
ncbi:MAG: gliding motility protein GldC [Lewinella sp.]|nr:gliding motility protein GldC [Lewinella sp.]